MDGALFIARLLLAAVFLVAAVGKARDLGGSRQAVAGFGVPEPLAGPLGTLLPVAELALALALLPDASGRLGALGALVLLSLFVVGIAVSLARGQSPECHCFGQIHSAPVGWRTLARNVALAAVAGLVAVAGAGDAGDAVGWVGDLNAAETVALAGALVLACIALLQGWFLANLFRQHGRILLRLDALEQVLGMPKASSPGLGLGAAAPDFRLPNLRGEPVTLDDLRAAGRPVMLIFSDPGCGPCAAMAPEIGRWQRDHDDEITIALLSRRDAEHDGEEQPERELANVLLQKEHEVYDAYKAAGTPSAVIVAPDGKVASAVAAGEEAIGSLLEQTLRAPAPKVLSPPGVPAAP